MGNASTLADFESNKRCWRAPVVPQGSPRNLDFCTALAHPVSQPRALITAMAKPHTTRDNESLQGVGTATKTYCRAALSIDPPVSGRSVGQLVVFPLDPTVRRAGGLVRQRYLRIELESSAVYHL